MALDRISSSTSSSTSSSVPRYQQQTFSSAPNSRLPSPPLSTMPESNSTNVTASSSTTSLVASPSIASSESPPPSITDIARSSSPATSLNESQNGNGEPSIAQQSQMPEVDPQILEALKSKDRLYVLKLGEQMETLINDQKPSSRIELTASTSYQRMLVHRCSAYYELQADSDQLTKMIIVTLSVESRIPLKRLADLVPAEATTQPAFKIMRRNPPERRPKPHSSTSSVTGEDGDLSDVEPSEAGSNGGRSSATSGSTKKRLTIEEREAAYKEARSRIFNGYDEKGKERDGVSSSSSLNSASASNGGGSVGDVDDSASSLANESERSSPTYNRRSNVSNSSSRSIRSGFTSSGSSSRNSRAASPSSFNFPSLYDPTTQTTAPYDPHSSSPYPQASYMYHYPQQTPNPPYAYQYYHPYPYQHVPPPSQNSPPEGSNPQEMYPPPPPHMMYGPNPYVWSPPPNQPSMAPPIAHQLSGGAQSPPQHPPPVQSPPTHPQSQQQYPQYMQTPAYYPMPGYYTPPAGQMHHRPPPGAPQFYDDTRLVQQGNGTQYTGADNQLMRGSGNNGHNGRNGGGRGNGGKHRGGQNMSSWSYGPGIGGVPMGSSNSSSSSSANGEGIAPRFNSSMRRTSNTSAGSSGQYMSSSNGDEAASQTSSTSSSSRRTYTSNTSSQHPLPARPDWAVGLTPDQNLHPSRHGSHHDSHNGSRNLSPISPPRSLNGKSARNSQSPPNPNDFPPLTTTDKQRTTASPAPGGAWTNTAARSLLLNPPTSGAIVQGNAASHQQAHQVPTGHAIPSDPRNVVVSNDPPHPITTMGSEASNGYERPTAKSPELYNPNPNVNVNFRVGAAKRGRVNVGGVGMGRGFPAPSPDAETQISLQFGSLSVGSGPSFGETQSQHQVQQQGPPAGLS